MNLSGSGLSLSVGGPGSVLNFSQRGARATFGIPGTGLSFGSPVFSPQSRFRNENVSVSPIRSVQDLVEAVTDPDASVVYTESGRRLSAQQLASLHKKLVTRELHGQAAAEIARIESALHASVNAWRSMPQVPTAAEYAAALLAQPFENTEPAPQAPDLLTAELLFREQVLVESTTENLRSEISRLLGPASGFGCGLAAGVGIWMLYHSLSFAIGIGGMAAVIVGWLTANAARKKWEKQIAEVAEQQTLKAWPAARNQHESDFSATCEAHSHRVAERRLEWEEREQVRVAWANRLCSGELDAIEDAIIESLSDLDFPFDSECLVGVDDPAAAFLNLDLPEIEDVIPDVRYSVLKNGSVRAIKRKAEERNAVYVGLVTGIALTAAASAFAAAPTVQLVSIAGYTQRKIRGTGEDEDVYVYEVQVPRETFSAFNATTINPVEVVARLPARIEWGSNFSLKKISAPNWASQLRE